VVLPKALVDATPAQNYIAKPAKEILQTIRHKSYSPLSYSHFNDT